MKNLALAAMLLLAGTKGAPAGDTSADKIVNASMICTYDEDVGAVICSNTSFGLLIGSKVTGDGKYLKKYCTLGAHRVLPSDDPQRCLFSVNSIIAGRTEISRKPAALAKDGRLSITSEGRK